MFLVIFTMACNEKATDTNSQVATEPVTTTSTVINDSARADNSTQTPASNMPSAQEKQAGSSSSQQPAATQVIPGQKSPLAGTYWRLLELNGKNVEGKTAREMYIFFDPSSAQFKSHSGCNLVMGEAKTRGTNQMWFINLLPTSGPCNTPEIDTEFQKAMEEVAGYVVNGTNLILSKKGSLPVMKFVAKR